MSRTRLRPSPYAELLDEFTDDYDHIVCCDKNRALCGTDVSGDDWIDDDFNDCPICEGLDDIDVPCGAFLCTLRRRFRR